MSTAASSRMGARRYRRSADVDREQGLGKTNEGVVLSNLPEGYEDRQPQVTRQLIQENESSSSGTVVPRKPLRLDHQQTVKLASNGGADRAGVRRSSNQYLARDAKHRGTGDSRIVVVGAKATGSIRAEQSTDCNPPGKEVLLNCCIDYFEAIIICVLRCESHKLCTINCSMVACLDVGHVRLFQNTVIAALT